MRLLSIVMGENNKDNRSSDTIAMMEYGFSMYGSKNILNKNEFEETMVVKNATNREVKYYLDKDVNLIVNKNDKNVKYTIDKKIYDVKAPLKKNSIVGELKLKYDNKIYKYNLIVKEDIKKASYMKVLSNILEDLISGVKIE